MTVTVCGVWVKVWLGSPEQAVELQLSRRRLRLVDDHTQMKSHEHSDVVDDSAGRGFDVPARLRAKVAMAHASVVTAVCGRCRRARDREALVSLLTLFWRSWKWKRPFTYQLS